MEFHTLGLGSSDARKSRACCEMAFRSETNSAAVRANPQVRFAVQRYRPPSSRSGKTSLQTLHRSYYLSPRYPLSVRFSHGLVAFSALLVLRRSRNFIRALCNCDLLLPMEHPTMLGNLIVLVSLYIVQQKNLRYPGGNVSTARCNCKRSIEPASLGSRHPQFFAGSFLFGFHASLPAEPTARPFLRNCISTTFTAMRCSQVEKADSPRKVPILRNNWRKASWVRSSAAAVLAVMRKHKEYTRRLCRLIQRFERFARRPAWPAQWPRLPKACRPVVFSRPSSRLSGRTQSDAA